MNFGNAAWGFRETPLEEQLRITKKLGLDILELGIANAPRDIPLNASENTLDNVKKLYKRYNIQLICAATGNDFSTGKKDDVEKVKKVTDMCAYIGVKYLRIFAGFSPAEEVMGKRWDNMMECLREVSVYGKEKGVTMTIETHGGVNAFDDGVQHFHSTSSKPDLLYKMLEELPEYVKVNFDPANLSAVGINNPETVYEKIRDRVAAVHLKDFAVLPTGHLKPSACGDGNTAWEKVIAALKDFNGPVLFEYENTEDVEAGSKKCFEYIKNIINKN